MKFLRKFTSIICIIALLMSLSLVSLVGTSFAAIGTEEMMQLLLRVNGSQAAYLRSLLLIPSILSIVV